MLYYFETSTNIFICSLDRYKKVRRQGHGIQGHRGQVVKVTGIADSNFSHSLSQQTPDIDPMLF